MSGGSGYICSRMVYWTKSGDISMIVWWFIYKRIANALFTVVALAPVGCSEVEFIHYSLDTTGCKGTTNCEL